MEEARHPPGSAAQRAAEDDGLHRRGHLASPDRHRQHVERDEPRPLQLPDALGGGEARRVGGRRFPARDEHDVHLRGLLRHLVDGLSQPPLDDDRGADRPPALRRRGPHGVVRQERARPGHGGRLGEQADDLPPRRADAARQLPGRIARLRHGQLQALGEIHLRRDVARRRIEARRLPLRLRRRLPHHGHGQHVPDRRRGSGAGAPVFGLVARRL